MSGISNGGRERAYQALRDSEELHRATLGSISDAVFLTDDEGAFTFICPNVDTIFGYVPDEVQSLSKIERLLGDNLFDPAELTAQGEIRNLQREVTAKSGEHRSVLIHLKRVSIQGATVLYTCRDITELKSAERELAATQLNLNHAARLALVGQLLTSIMHEIQQPLVSIRLNVAAGIMSLDAQREAAGFAKLREALDNINGGASAAIEIIDRLQTLARKKPLALRAVDLNDVTNDVLRLVRADAARRRVALQADLAPSLPAVEADRTSMQQVILDLIVNAMDAMEGNEGERAVVVQTRPGTDFVEIAVNDLGDGIDADHRPKIFEAFFTTKPDGLGMGLAIAHSIVSAHGGRIWSDDRTGPGATFRVRLPMSTKKHDN